MNDKLKNIIKNSMSEYEIKLTSSQILNTFKSEQIKEEKPKFNFFKIFTPVIGLATAFAAAIIIIPSLNNISSTPIDITQIEYKQANSRQNQAAFSIFSGMNIITSFNEVDKIDMLKMAHHPNEDFDDDRFDDFEHSNEDISFEEMVYTFDPCVNVVTSLFEKSINVDSTLTEGEFVGKYDTYPYKLTVQNYVLYTNITLVEEDDDEEETTYIGELFVSENEIYKVELVIEIEEEDQDDDDDDDDDEVDNYSQSILNNDNNRFPPFDDGMHGNPPSKEDNDIDTEIEMTIHYDETSYLVIEQEFENDERTYCYTLYENDEEIYQENVTFDNRRQKNDSCSVEIYKDEKTYEYNDIKPIKDGLTCAYRGNRKEGDNRFTLKFVDNKRVYTSMKNEKIEIF